MYPSTQVEQLTFTYMQTIQLTEIEIRLLTKALYNSMDSITKEIPHWKALELIFAIRAKYEKLV